MHVCRAVARQLDRLEPGPAADVEAPLVAADALSVEVLPDQEAALRGHEHARLDRDLREIQGEHLAPARVAPAEHPIRGQDPAAVGLVGQRRGTLMTGLGLEQASTGGGHVLGARRRSSRR